MAKWFQQNRLYLLLIACILTVGLGTWVLIGITPSTETPIVAEPKEEQPVQTGEVIEVTAPPAEEAIEPITVSMPEIVETPVVTEEPKVVSYRLPLNGKIIREYAVEHLIYSATMGDWRTHAGLDFSADVGTPVYAVADGVITSIQYEDLRGITVKAEHPDGRVSVYANLASLDSVKNGDSVKQGDVIGAVGETALFEMDEPPHLHFEIYDQERVLNPADVLPILP